MEREDYDGKICLIGYHTQEFRASSSSLKNPVLCQGSNAWLGTGYYFWTEEEFAHYWGQDSKKATGSYDIYHACLDNENCLNTVFDEHDYFYFRKKVEEAIQYFRKNGLEPTLELINRFLADNVWNKVGVAGILYDDKPTNPRRSDRVYSDIPNLYYKKRIQIVIFSLKNIRNFTLYLTKQ